MKSKSAGGIVLNPLNQVVIVRQKEGTWSLPKGHVNQDESEDHAARREIGEETSITQLELIKFLGSYQRLSMDKIPEEKDIFIFLYRTSETDVRPNAADVSEVRWVNLQTAAKLLTHPKDAEYFLSVQNDILSHLE